MTSTRVKLLVVSVFALTLGAGVVLGKLGALWMAQKQPADIGAPDPVPATLVSDSSLGEQLSLTADQRDKMKPIWESMRGLSDESLKDSLKAARERDEAIEHLIPQDKISAYREISEKYDNTVAGLKGRRQKAFNDAVKETKKILSAKQCEKYGEILRKRLGADYDGGHDSTGASPVTQPGS